MKAGAAESRGTCAVRAALVKKLKRDPNERSMELVPGEWDNLPPRFPRSAIGKESGDPGSRH